MPQPRSFSHSYTSSSLSSFSSSSSITSSLTASTAIARRSSTHRLKRWLSTRLLPTTRQDTPTNHTRNRNSHYDVYNRKVSCAYTDSHRNSTSQLDSQLDSTSKIPNETEQEHEHSLTHNQFRSFDYDYEYINTYNNHPPTDPEAEATEREAEGDLALSDNYAAYCRAFTASPTLFRPAQARPLPSFPQSESWDDLQQNREANPNADHDYDTQQTGSDAHLNPDIRAQADGSQIGFLPIGAHGYHPAEWTRAPSPPPGILTPARYEAIQMREREKIESKKMKRKRRFPTWCMPIRLFLWPWDRTKQS
ncbi:hypothetical protein BDV06DRAFT_202577 [Aspergillus oleicola]